MQGSSNSIKSQTHVQICGNFNQQPSPVRHCDKEIRKCSSPTHRRSVLAFTKQIIPKIVFNSQQLFPQGLTAFLKAGTGDTIA